MKGTKWLLAFLLAGLLATPPGVAQTFQVGPAKPSYMLAFVLAPNVEDYIHVENVGGVRVETPRQRYVTRYGNDAHHPDEIQTHQELYILHPQSNTPIKIFPLPIHFSNGLIDAPADHGAVAEPNVSLDGNSLLVTYFHDITQFARRPSNEGNLRTRYGADIYKIDVSPLAGNVNYNPANLQVQRLTTQPVNVNEHALNQTMADNTVYAYGKVIHMHAIEILTEQGLRVVYVSDKRHIQNSNFQNNQYNIFVAKYGPQGELIHDNQFHYYTTTSAISPVNLRNGFAFSYHANTRGVLVWEFQQSNSAGKWAPLQGYAHTTGGRHAWHNGTLCRTSDPRGDLWVGEVYYSSNNGGYGGLWGLDPDEAGKNVRFANGVPGLDANSTAFDMTRNIQGFGDSPSLSSVLSGSNFAHCDEQTAAAGLCFGKMTTPGCGGQDHLFITKSPTYANLRNLPATWLPGTHPPIFDGHIVFRNNLWTPGDIANPNDFVLVLDETTDQYSLLWPRPILSFEERFNDTAEFSRHVTPLDNHLPIAKVGTSALHHTDVAPMECRFNGQVAITDPLNDNGYGYRPYDPTTMVGSAFGNYRDMQTSLTFVRDHDPFSLAEICDTPVLPENVFGISINLTNNKTDILRLGHAGGRNEQTKRLCVRKTKDQAPGNTDHSVMAYVPANVPFDFHLLHEKYALKLADVRSWHSLKAGETRNDCGGCHYHGTDKPPIPFEGKLADSPSYQIEDCVNDTTVIEYDAQCVPQVVVKNTPAEANPVMTSDGGLFQGMINNCGGCHSPGQSGESAFIVYTQPTYKVVGAQQVIDQTAAQRTIVPMQSKGYINTYDGALGSPAFWAARGERTDGRDNTQYAAPSNFVYSSVHDSLNLCTLGDNWVYEFGLWIDTLALGDWHFPYNGPEVDSYHPTVSFGLKDVGGCAPGQGIKFGVWDDSGSVANVTIKLNGSVVFTQDNVANGSHDAASVVVANNTDSVEIVARDATGNRQMYSADLEQLLHECNNPNANSGAFGGHGPSSGGGNSGGEDDSMDEGGNGGIGKLSLHPPGNPVVLGTSTRVTVRGSAELIGKPAVLMLGSEVDPTGVTLDLHPGSIHIPFGADDWLFQHTSGLFRAVFADDGANEAFASFTVPWPKTLEFRGVHHIFAASYDSATGELFAVSEGTSTITVIPDLNELREMRDQLVEELELNKKRMKRAAQKIRRFKKRRKEFRSFGDERRAQKMGKKIRKKAVQKQGFQDQSIVIGEKLNELEAVLAEAGAA